MDYIFISLILLLSIILFLAEIFILPGITIAGISGIVIAVIGFAYAYFSFGITGLIASIIMGIVVFLALFYACMKSKIFDKFALKKNINSTVQDKNLKHISKGDEVRTVSRLNPMGKIIKENEFFEAKSESGYIDEDQTVYVCDIRGNTVIVSSEKPNDL